MGKKVFTDESLNTLVSEIKSYTDDVSTNVVSTHNSSTTAHSDIRNLITSVQDEFEDHDHDDKYYTETEIDNMEFITTDDIDTICGEITEGGATGGAGSSVNNGGLSQSEIDELFDLLN